MLKKMLLTFLFCLTAVVSFAAPKLDFVEDFTKLKAWRVNDATALKFTFDESKFQEKTLKLEFKIDNPAVGNGWPQVSRNFIPVCIDGGDIYIEFDVFEETTTPNKAGLRMNALPMSDIRELPFKTAAGKWTHVSIPMMPKKKKSTSVNGVMFVISRRGTKANTASTFYIKNLRVVHGAAKPLPRFDSAGNLLRPGILSQTVVPASSRPQDKRLEIEINTLINNGYFRIGSSNPPEGWNSYGGETYQKGVHDGRAIRLAANNNPKQKTLALRQNGLVMIPGEKYRFSGYIRGEGFTGRMDGHIGIACDNWSKIRAYFFTEKDIKPDWQYFEFEFTPDYSKAKEYEVIVYRNNKGGGYIDVSRLILEPVSPAAIKGSRNKYQDDKFSENYAKALKAGNFRSGPPTKDYKLVWSDEFDGTAIDLKKWLVLDMYRTNSNRPYYLTPANVTLDGQGHLCMTTKKEANGRISQPRITSSKRQTWVYGYFEARIQFHDSDLVNAAFWMLPEGQMSAFDPVNKGEEIDIMECITPSRNTLSHTTHWWHSDPKTKQHFSFSGGTRARTVPNLNKGWHTIALEWTPTDMYFYIDGIESWHVNCKEHPITKAPENIIFSFGARAKEVLALKEFSTTFKVDYVRVYQKQWK